MGHAIGGTAGPARRAVADAGRIGPGTAATVIWVAPPQLRQLPRARRHILAQRAGLLRGRGDRERGISPRHTLSRPGGVAYSNIGSRFSTIGTDVVHGLVQVSGWVTVNS